MCAAAATRDALSIPPMGEMPGGSPGAPSTGFAPGISDGMLLARPIGGPDGGAPLTRAPKASGAGAVGAGAVASVTAGAVAGAMPAASTLDSSVIALILISSGFFSSALTSSALLSLLFFSSFFSVLASCLLSESSINEITSPSFFSSGPESLITISVGLFCSLTTSLLSTLGASTSGASVLSSGGFLSSFGGEAAASATLLLSGAATGAGVDSLIGGTIVGAAGAVGAGETKGAGALTLLAAAAICSIIEFIMAGGPVGPILLTAAAFASPPLCSIGIVSPLKSPFPKLKSPFPKPLPGCCIAAAFAPAATIANRADWLSVCALALAIKLFCDICGGPNDGIWCKSMGCDFEPG